MQLIKSIFSIIGLVLVALVAILVIFSFTGIILAFVAVVLGIVFLAWACGYPVQVTSNDVPIGYVRWTKFYPYGVTDAKVQSNS